MKITLQPAKMTDAAVIHELQINERATLVFYKKELPIKKEKTGDST